MRIDETTAYNLYAMYEHGEYHHSLRKLEINPSIDRSRLRDIITHFINKHCKIEDNKHPIFSMHVLMLREVIEALQQESKGVKFKLGDDAPSVF